MEFRYLTFYSYTRLQFLDVETNPGRRRPLPTVCRLLSNNVQGLAGNLSDLTMASSQYDILLCSETWGLRYALRVGVAGSRIWLSCHVVPVQDASGPMVGGIHTRWGYGTFHQREFECGCCDMLDFMV